MFVISTGISAISVGTAVNQSPMRGPSVKVWQSGIHRCHRVPAVPHRPTACRAAAVPNRRVSLAQIPAAPNRKRSLAYPCSAQQQSIPAVCPAVPQCSTEEYLAVSRRRVALQGLTAEYPRCLSILVSLLLLLGFRTTPVKTVSGQSHLDYGTKTEHPRPYVFVVMGWDQVPSTIWGMYQPHYSETLRQPADITTGLPHASCVVRSLLHVMPVPACCFDFLACSARC